MPKEIKNTKKEENFNTKNTTPKKSPNNQTLKSSNKNNYSNSSIKLEIICIMIICISLILFISVFFNGGGALGGVLSSFLKGIFGIGAYILPILSICFCIFIFFSKEKKINIFKFSLSIICFFIVITFFHILTKDKNAIYSNYGVYLINKYKSGNFLNGGILGALGGDLLLKIMGNISSYIFLIITFIASIVLLSGKSFFIFTKKIIKNISNHFYYEYSIKNEDFDEDFDEFKNKKSIFSIIKQKLTNFKNNNYNKQDEILEEDLNYENFDDINTYQNNEKTTNKRILKKQRDYIYDGMDRYIKMEIPTFFKITENNQNNNDGKLKLAINEINKTKNLKAKNEIYPRNEAPSVLKKENINKQFDENNVSDFNIKNYYTLKNNEYENNTQNNDFDTENNFNNHFDNNIQNDFNLNENLNENYQNDFENLNNPINKKLKRTDFSDYNLGQTIYEIDFDIPSRKEIDELFSIPPENELSEDIDFEQLNKIDLFYDFQDDFQDDFQNDFQDDFQNDNFSYNQNTQNTQNYKSQNINEYNKHNDISNNAKLKFNNIENDETKNQNLNENLNETNKSSLNYEKNNPINTPQKEPIIIRPEKEKILNEAIIEEKKEYQFPKLSFLTKNTNISNTENDMELRENSNILIKTLKSFNVNAEVINISKGPSVTRYELSIEDGIKVSKILGLADNLALSLAASSIRIEAPIPGKSAVGIEIPNKEVNSVFLSEVICSEKFQKYPSKVSFGIGKDITGNVIVTDIAKMPHMLIAGATGSGKSVCINTLITSILYKASPDEVRLMMIDPKVVELSVYNGIPHLLTPVVTEPEKAAGVLNWAVSEMMERYNLFAQTGTRNLVGYNQLKIANDEEALPQIVIIIDELADLMMVAAKEVESAICRLAQLARAAGIHLIIATQRPSVDVITGLIKANVPSRIAFAVSSGTDSRTVIDSVGAEKLLGKGDMLFKAVDMNKPLRIQGAFISDKEVEQIVTFIKQNNATNYDENIINKIESCSKKDDISSNSSESDELTEEVIAFLVKKGKASTSMIQRQFRIGYNRAARIIEELEDRGIISSENGSKQRDVLMDKYQYEEYINRY